MITKFGRVTFTTDGIFVEGFEYTDVRDKQQAEEETLLWVLSKVKLLAETHKKLRKVAERAKQP